MKIYSMLPFLDKIEIDLLIDQALEKKIDLKLVHVLPYADEAKIDQVIDRALNDDSVLVYMSHLLPFLNERQMERLYEAYQEGVIKGTEICENDMLPFLSKDKIKEIFEKKLKSMNLKIKKYIEIAIEEINNTKDNK